MTEKSVHDLINEPLTGPSTLEKFGLLERTGKNTYDVILISEQSGTYSAIVTVEADDENTARNYALDDAKTACWELDSKMSIDDVWVDDVTEVE